MKKLNIKNLKFRIRKSDRIKSPYYAYLKLNRNLELELVVPRNTKVNTDEIINKKRDWILSKVKEFAHNKPVFKDDSVLYKGKTYKLLFKKSEKTSLVFNNSGIIIKARNKGEALSRIKEWMKKQSKEMVLDLVDKYSKLMDVKANKIYFRSSRKWGSNSNKGNISFNWQIAGLPKELAEYVIIHELTHLKVFKHNDKFWSIMSDYCSDYLEREKALKEYTAVKIQ